MKLYDEDPLDRYDREIGQHLQAIELHAQICARHAKALFAKPVYQTKAKHELDQCWETLLNAAASVQLARELYKQKQVVK